jgi:hypothetical protein
MSKVGIDLRGGMSLKQAIGDSSHMTQRGNRLWYELVIYSTRHTINNNSLLWIHHPKITSNTTQHHLLTGQAVFRSVWH